MIMTTRAGVVVPTYNERDNIIAVAEAVHRHLPEATILVVDDSSPDDTAGVVRQAAETRPYVRLKVRAEKQGLGPAYIDGFRTLLADGFDPIVQMDADFSHRPEQVPDLVAAVQGEADLAIGSRYVPGGTSEGLSPRRLWLSSMGSRYASRVLGLPVRDATTGFKCWAADLLTDVIRTDLLLHGFGFQIEMDYRAHLLGAQIREVPIQFDLRRDGESKMSMRIAAEALLGVWRLRLRGRRLVTPR